MKKTLAIILSALMVLCMMPSMAFAEGPAGGDLSSATVNVGALTYTGSKLEPSISVSLNDSSVDPSNYTVSYTKKGDAGQYEAATEVKDAGDYKVKVTGRGSGYYNEKVAEFTVAQADFTKVTYGTGLRLPSDTTSFTAKDLELKFNSIDVSEDDVEINCEGFASGPNTVKVTSTNKNFSTGSFNVIVTGATSIEGYKIHYNGVEISKDYDTKFVYNGRPQSFDTSKLTLVKDSSTPLKYGSDFTVSYSKNTDATTNQSLAEIIATGTGAYAGEVKAKFKIEQYDFARSDLYIEALGTVPENSTPKPIVKMWGPNGTTLKEDTDFEFIYDRSDSKTIKVSVTYKGSNFKGTSRSVSFTVGKSIVGALVTLDGFTKDAKTNKWSTYPALTYNGRMQRPAVVVRLNGASTPLSTSYYSVTYQNDTNASTTARPAKVIIKGTNGYAGTIECEYNIKQMPMTNVRISMSSSLAYIPIGDYSSNYNTILMPDFTVYDSNNRALVRGTDYYVSSYSYTNNSTKAAVNITLTGKGNYSGSYYAYNVVLNGTSMANCRVELSQTSYKYTGYNHTPTVKVYNGSTLVPSTYYIVTYKNNKDIGTATVTVTGTNGYTGSQNAYFTITGNTINTCTISLSQTKYSYDGTYKRPTVTVRDGYTTLRENTDYTLTYSNNRIAGTATVVIKGIGKYSGTVTKEFTIEGLNQTLTTKYTKYTKYPTSSNFNLGAYANGDGTGFTYTSSDTSVARVSTTGDVEIVGTGIAKITVATKGTTRYNPASKEVTVTVKPNKPSFSLSTPDSREIKVTITKVKGATKYQVKYGRQGNYYSKYITHLANGYTKTSTTLKNRKSGVNYFIKVRAYKTLPNGEKVWGNWTTVKKIRARY